MKISRFCPGCKWLYRVSHGAGWRIGTPIIICEKCSFTFIEPATREWEQCSILRKISFVFTPVVIGAITAKVLLSYSTILAVIAAAVCFVPLVMKVRGSKERMSDPKYRATLSGFGALDLYGRFNRKWHD
jgi:hypothetical protein